jgi:Fe-S cluster assembly ATP-binding protein
MSMLQIENLHARVEGKEILKGLSLTVNAGEVHAIMGPNGAGKSTLGNVLCGRDGYEVTAGSVSYNGVDLLTMAPEARAAAGVFLAFQYPVEIPGVNNTYFLRAALNAQRKVRGEKELDSMQFLKLVREKLKVMQISDELLHRAVNEGQRHRLAGRGSAGESRGLRGGRLARYAGRSMEVHRTACAGSAPVCQR